MTNVHNLLAAFFSTCSIILLYGSGPMLVSGLAAVRKLNRKLSTHKVMFAGIFNDPEGTLKGIWTCTS